jgi:hypothetical protein
MARSMQSESLEESIEELMAGYVLGDLSPEEAERLAQVLTTDPSVQSGLAELEQALQLAFDPPLLPVPTQLKGRVLKAAALSAQSVPETPADPIAVVGGITRSKTPSIPPESLAVWRWLGGLGLAASLVLGFNNIRLWQQLQLAQVQPAEPGLEVTLNLTLDPTDPDDRASGEIAVDLAARQAILTVSQLPVLPQGEVYALWTVVDESAPVTVDPLGASLMAVFAVDESGQATVAVDLPPFYRTLEVVRAIAITRERAESPQEHEGSPVLIAWLEE